MTYFSGHMHFKKGHQTCMTVNIIICDSPRQNTWSYLRRMAVLPLLGVLFNIFNCIFCPVQLQMVIFDFEEKRTGNLYNRVYIVGCNIPAKFR